MTAVLEILSSGVALGDDGVSYPTVVLDATNRPDVRDLPRVHAAEGVGDLRTAAVATPWGVDLTVSLTRPVSASFSIRFHLPRHRVVLADAASTGSLLLATSSPTDPDALPIWLAVDLDGPSLRAVLDGRDR